MREIRIPKGNGTYRTVYVPSRKRRKLLRRILAKLQQAERAAATVAGTSTVAHGFVRGRSPVTCAAQHIGYEVTISADLSSWFDSVRPDQIAQGLALGGVSPTEALQLAESVCHLGAPRQGLPTSPTAANLAAVVLDRFILDGLSQLDPSQIVYTYTRYADDLCISLSVDSPIAIKLVLDLVEESARRMGWTVAEHKTRFQRRKAGRRVVVGISVGDSDLRPTRRTRRRHRAVAHLAQRRHGGKLVQVAHGLAEWCAMRLPRESRPSRSIAGIAGPSGAMRRDESSTVKREPTEGRCVGISASRRILITD